MNLRRITSGISGRIARMVIASVVASATLVGATGAVAHAGGVWELDDGLDFQPASTWRHEAYGTSGGGFDLNVGTARTAPNNAFLWAQTQFSAVGRSVTLRNNASRIDCGAGIYINGLSGAKVNFEIINSSTNTYISLRSVTLSGGGYRLVTVPSWRGGPNTVYVRVSLLGTGVFNLIRIDDLVVQCSY